MKEQSTDDKEKPVKISLAGIVYGDIIYWTTIAATFLVIAGSMLMFLSGENFIDPAYLIGAVMDERSKDDIWCGAVGNVPNGHWYLSQLSTGNGLTMAGIALGVFSVIPAIVGASFYLLKDRQWDFASLAVVAALVTIIAMGGSLNFLTKTADGPTCTTHKQAADQGARASS